VKTKALTATMVAVAVAVVIAVGAAGCGGTGNDPAPPGDPSAASVGFGSNPAPQGSTAATQAANPTVVAPKPPSYPGTAMAYAEAVLAAWKQKNLARLADLTTAQVHEQIIEIPGPPNQTWTFRDCEDDATVYCGFFNAVGDWISLRIDKDKLGASHAASAVEFDATVYPADAVAYVKAFVLGWQFGNAARMLQLSKASVVNQLDLDAPPDGESYPDPTCCGGGLVQVVVAWGGASVTFDVGSTLLGTPHAIVGYSP
jgi:hypothetical protein